MVGDVEEEFGGSWNYIPLGLGNVVSKKSN
jgi:hypothetical protein